MSWGSWVLRLACVGGLLVRAKRHNSLTTAGLFTALVTGVIHSVTPSCVNLVLLMGFFATGTKFTKYKASVKQQLTEKIVLCDNSSKSSLGVRSSSSLSSSDSGTPSSDEPRNHIQVLANSGIASCLILCQLAGLGSDAVIQTGIIAHYAAVTADTWSSELGILSKSDPFLITSLQTCPKGTNGGVSPFGLAVAGLGGMFIGLLSLICRPSFVEGGWLNKLVFITAIGAYGLFGSVTDSLLGALFQRSVVNSSSGKIVEVEGGHKFEGKGSQNGSGAYKAYSGLDVLSNNQVNVAMAAITTFIAMIVKAYL